MKKTIAMAFTHFSLVVNGIEIPNNVIHAVRHAEGGRSGTATKEPNGRYSYGAYQISKSFLTDVNKWHGSSFTISQVRDRNEVGALVCGMGLAMIMEKRKCDIKTALAVYNGGWKNRNKKQCKAYADKVMRLAKEKTK